MSVIDDRGRLFGRLNLVDATVAAMVVLLIPLAYVTFLLFRPAVPRIDSVAPSAISKEEVRISAGGRLVAKFKVKGTGFTPLLRARIGDADALGFVFETPNSADVLVGPVPPGTHDLVLLDGVQEVARAAGAITVHPVASSKIRAVGWLTNLDAEQASALKVGTALPEGAPAFEIVALGPLQPARTRVSLAGSWTDIPGEGLQERAAVVLLRCDAALPDNPCTLGDRLEYQRPPVVLSLPGPTRYFGFALHELLPTAAPRRARVTVRVPGETLAQLVRTGDRDQFLDERAAIVTGAGRMAGSVSVTLEMGLDAAREGLRYRSQPIAPGAAFEMTTPAYQLRGTVDSVALLGSIPGESR